MMFPFGSAFAVNNIGVSAEQLPQLFFISGISSLVIMPLIGKLSDKVSKFKIFTVACVWMIIMVVVYTNLGISAFWIIVVLNILMMMGIMSRMIPATALVSGVPDMEDRGAFMSINASMQQIAGGVAAVVAGLIVVQEHKSAPLEHYNIVGYLVVAITLFSIYMMHRVSKIVATKG